VPIAIRSILRSKHFQRQTFFEFRHGLLGTRIQPNYSAEEVLGVIAVSTGSMLMFGRLLAILADRKPAADQIEEVIINFESALK
jgi:ethanolamine ammonia-lyase large subunit